MSEPLLINSTGDIGTPDVSMLKESDSIVSPEIKLSHSHSVPNEGAVTKVRAVSESKSRKSAAMYLGKRLYGRMGDPRVEDSDSDEDREDPDLIGKSPMTRRNLKEEKVKGEVTKLGNF